MKLETLDAPVIWSRDSFQGKRIEEGRSQVLQDIIRESSFVVVVPGLAAHKTYK